MKIALRVGLALIGLLLLLVLVSVTLLVTVDPNNHKEWLANQVRENTGYTIHFDGDIAFELYPWLRLEVNGVRIENPPEFGPEPMLNLERFAFRARLLPMLSRNFEIDTVELHGLDANLITLADGRSNWVGLEGEEEPEEAQDDPVSDLPFNDLRLGGIDIDRINVVIDDRASGQRVTVSDLRFFSGELIYGEPIDAELAFTASSSEPALAADFALTTVLTYDLDNNLYDISPLQLRSEIRGASVPDGRASLALDTALHFDLAADSLTAESISLTALGTELEASLNASALQSADPRVATTLNLRADDLALLFEVAGEVALAEQLRGLADRSAVLSSEINVRAGSGAVQVVELELSLLGAEINGAVDAEGLNGDTPALSGRLNAAGPNLPSVLEVIGQVMGGRNSKLAEGGRLMQRIADKEFDVDTEFAVDLGTGTVDVPRLAVLALGAEVSGRLQAQALDSSEPAVQGQVQASGPDLPLLLQIGGWFQGGEQSALFQAGSQLSELADRRFAFNSEFDADLRSGAVRVPVLSGQALGVTMEGSFNATDIDNGNSPVSGSFTLTGANLRPLLAALQQPELAEVTRSLSVQAGFGGTSNDLTINPARVELVVAGNNIPNSPATVTFDAQSRLNLQRETLQIDSFALAGLGLDLRGSVTASELMTTPRASGGLEIGEFNPRELLQQLNQPLPETSDASVLQVLALSTGFEYAAERIALSELALRLDETHVSGEFAWQTGAATNDWQLELAVDQVNVDRYLPPTSDQTAADTDSAVEALPVPVDLIRSLNGRGSLAIGQIQAGGLRLAEVALGVAASAGVIELNPLRSNLYEGSFNGNAALNASGELPEVTVDLLLQQVAIEPLLQDMMSATYVSGRGNVELDLSTRGADTLALSQGLDGQGRIALEDGVLRGVDVAGVLNQLETMIRSRSPGQLTRGQQTAFENFSATLDFTQGVVSSNDLLIQSPGFRISGSGTLVNLRDDSIGYNLQASVDAATATRNDQQYDIGGYSVPIACSGSLAAPRCLPDAGQIFRNALSNELRDAAGNFLQRALGTGQNNQGATADGANADDASQQQSPADQLLNQTLDRLLPN